MHCPFCFGWELRDQPLAVLATGPQAAAQALMWRQWSQDVVLFLHTAPTPAAEQVEQLAARGISLVEGEVTGVEVTGDFGHPIVQSFEPGEDWFWNCDAGDALIGPRLAPPTQHPARQPVPGPAGRVPADWRFDIH